MKKLATSGNKVYCELSTPEFATLARQSAAGVPDGTDVSIAWVKHIAGVVDSKKAELGEIAQSANKLITSINAVIK